MPKIKRRGGNCGRLFERRAGDCGRGFQKRNYRRRKQEKKEKAGGGPGVEQAVSLTLSEILVPRIRLAAAVGVVPKLVDYVTDALQGKLFQNMKKQSII